jgi:hypothetical protein
MRCNGQWYYEVTLGDDFGEWAFPQIGWATDLFVEQCYGKYGIGNCYESLGVCGVRHKIWHLDEETFSGPGNGRRVTSLGSPLILTMGQ